MKAEAKSLWFLGQAPQKIIVPFFQRRYVWEESNWKELYDNVSNTESKPFLGSIILKELRKSNPSEAIIVDGQQRLTTLTLLAKSLFDSIDTNKYTGVKSSIENFLFYKINSADDFTKSNVKICHSLTDSSDYNRIIRAGLLDEKLDFDSLIIKPSNIAKCYLYFKQIVDKLSEPEKINLFNNLFNEDRKMLVLIMLEENDVNEQSIFDAINRTGVRLNSADIVKNYLFQRCLDLCNGKHEDVIKIYNSNWGEYFYCSKHVSNLWDNERAFGNNSKTNLEFLLYCFSIIKWGITERSFSDLPSVFKFKTYEFKYEDFISLVQEINAFAKIFYDRILILQQKILSDEPIIFSFNDFENRFLLMLEKFGVQMFYPYVLFSFHNSKSKEELSLRLKKLESFIIRNRIAKKSVSDYANKCSELIHNPNGISVINRWYEQDSDLSDLGINNKLNDVKSDTAKMVLFNIELYLRSSKKEDVPGLHYKLSLEHIMPQNWERNWKKVQVIDERGVNLTDKEWNPISPYSLDDVVSFRKNHINNIGNMTLLTSSLNSAIKNSDYEVKMGDGISAGYIANSSLKITKMLTDSYKSGDKVWDEAHIIKRKKLMLEHILKIWPTD